MVPEDLSISQHTACLWTLRSGQSKPTFPRPQIQTENSPPFSLSKPRLLCDQQGWWDPMCRATPTGRLSACVLQGLQHISMLRLQALPPSKPLFRTCILRQSSHTLKPSGNYLPQRFYLSPLRGLWRPISQKTAVILLLSGGALGGKLQ